MTHPTDQLDIASELEESERAHGAALVRAALQSQGADECRDCGDVDEILELIKQVDRYV